MNRIFGIFALALLLISLQTGTSAARSVFLRDGTVIEDVRSVSRAGGQVNVVINRDVVVTLQADEVDMKKTFGAAKKAAKKPVAAKKVHQDAPVAKREAGAGAGSAVVAAEPAGSAKNQAQVPKQPQVKNDVSGNAAPAATAVQKVEAKPVSSPPPPAVPTAQQEAAMKEMEKAAQQAMAQGGGKQMLGMLLLASPFGFFFLLMIVIVFVTFLIFWKVFVKAGEAGWKSLVPIYNLIIMLRLADRPAWWCLLFFVPVINLVFMTLMHIELAKRFGKEAWFGFGLTLIPTLFFGIIAFDDSSYSGA